MRSEKRAASLTCVVASVLALIRAIRRRRATAIANRDTVSRVAGCGWIDFGDRTERTGGRDHLADYVCSVAAARGRPGTCRTRSIGRTPGICCGLPDTSGASRR